MRRRGDLGQQSLQFLDRRPVTAHSQGHADLFVVFPKDVCFSKPIVSNRFERHDIISPKPDKGNGYLLSGGPGQSASAEKSAEKGNGQTHHHRQIQQRQEPYITPHGQILKLTSGGNCGQVERAPLPLGFSKGNPATWQEAPCRSHGTGQHLVLLERWNNS